MNIEPDLINEFASETDAPLAGGMARRVNGMEYAPGAPFTIQPQNDLPSFSNSEKKSENNQLYFPEVEKSEKNSILPVVKTTSSKGLIVKQGEYKPEYGPLMYEWFASKEKKYITYETFVWKNGEVSEKKKLMPNPPPHFSEYARSIGVTWSVLRTWSKKHKQFGMYYEACVDIVQEFLIDNGITGDYSAQFGIFAAKNLTKMRDVVVNKNENWDMKDVLDALEKGLKPGETHEF